MAFVACKYSFCLQHRNNQNSITLLSKPCSSNFLKLGEEVCGLKIPSATFIHAVVIYKNSTHCMN